MLNKMIIGTDFKELLKSGSTWRKAAKLMPRKLIGVRERVHTVGSAKVESVQSSRPPVLRISFRLADLGTRLRELEIIPDLVQTYAQKSGPD